MKVVRLKGSEISYPVNKILCIGQNYAEHAKEMNFEVPPAPVFFLKPATAIISDGEKVLLPSLSKNVHHEVELVVLIGKGGKNIPESEALFYIAGYGVGLDMTMRDVQLEAKAKGLPWTLAKGFDTSAPVSEFVPPETLSGIEQLRLELTVNDTLRQSGKPVDMVFSIPKLLAYISRFVSFEKGDLLFTGTPPGVGSVKEGDCLVARLLDNGTVLTSLTVTIAAEQ